MVRDLWHCRLIKAAAAASSSPRSCTPPANLLLFHKVSNYCAVGGLYKRIVVLMNYFMLGPAPCRRSRDVCVVWITQRHIDLYRVLLKILPIRKLQFLRNDVVFLVRNFYGYCAF